MFWLFFQRIFFFIDFLGRSLNFPHFWNVDPPTPSPGCWTPRGGVGKNLIYWISGHSWVSLTLKAAKTTSLRRRIHCDVICHTTARRRIWQLSPDWPQWPHASRPFMGPIFGRNHSQVYPHMRAKFGHDRSSSLAAYTWQTDRHTHRQNLYYIDTSWIPGFARDPLSRSLSPSLSRPSLPSLVFVPAFYPPSLGLPGFAQDNCIPEIFLNLEA